jgi:hypothetical protein
VANALNALVPQGARSGTWWPRNYFVSRRTAQTAGGLAGSLAQIAKAIFKSHNHPPALVTPVVSPLCGSAWEFRVWIWVSSRCHSIVLSRPRLRREYSSLSI